MSEKDVSVGSVSHASKVEYDVNCYPTGDEDDWGGEWQIRITRVTTPVNGRGSIQWQRAERELLLDAVLPQDACRRLGVEIAKTAFYGLEYFQAQHRKHLKGAQS